MNSSPNDDLPLIRKVLLGGLAAAGFLVMLVAMNWHGAGLSPDSVGYIGAARNIAGGAGVMSYDGSPLIVQPPLYPILLSVGNMAFGIDPLLAAPIINAGLFGLIIYLAGLMIFRKTRSKPLVMALGAVFVLTSIALVEVSLMAWSEPLFICFVLLYLVNFNAYQEEGELRSLILLSLAVTFACLTRYIGIVLIPVGVASIWFFRQGDRKTRSIHELVFLAITLLPIGGWALRNYLQSGTAFGSRTSAIFSVSQNLDFAFSTLLKWFAPETAASNGFFQIMMILVLGLAGGILVWKAKAGLREVLLDVGPILTLVVAYAGFLIAYSSITAFDVIGNRLLSPVAVPVILLVIIALCRMAVLLEARYSSRVAHVALGAVLTILILHPLATSFSMVRNHLEYGGWGYNSTFWKGNQVVERLKQQPEILDDCTVYTNAPDLAYISANISARMAPIKSNVNSAVILNDLTQLKGHWPEEDKACLVWFDDIKGDYLYSVDDLRQAADIERTVELPDGGIYTLFRKKV